MNLQNNIPNDFQQSNQEGFQQKPKPVIIEALPQIIIRLIVVAILCIIVWTIIREISGLGSAFSSNIMSWFKSASINPENKKEFTNFLKLLLTGGFIGFLLNLIRKK
jgi:type III secretory pathway component EscU